MGRPYSRSSRPQYPGRRTGGNGGSRFKLFVMICLIMGPLWMWAYHQDMPIAVATWQATSTVHDRVADLVVGSARDLSSALSEASGPALAEQETPQAGHSREYAGGVPLSPAGIEEWVIEFTNQERIGVGLPPLRHDTAISDISRSHSEAMAQINVLSHDIGGRDPTDRAMAAGYDCRAYFSDGSYTYGLSENVAEHPRVTRWMGQWGSFQPIDYDRDAEAMARGLVQGWMSSPGHRENILDSDARRIGVGVAIWELSEYGYVSETVFATQNFSACS